MGRCLQLHSFLSARLVTKAIVGIYSLVLLWGRAPFEVCLKLSICI